MKIIGLVGYKRSGKTTAAKYLEEKYGFTRHNFKDALIAELKQNFPDLLGEILKTENEARFEWCQPEITLDDLFVVKPPLIRALMVNYGTEVRRKEEPDYWVHQWKMKVPDLLALDKYTIVADDVRFLNEAEAIKGWSGTIIRIVREDIPTGGDHQSETEQQHIEADYTITVGPGEHNKLFEELDKILL